VLIAFARVDAPDRARGSMGMAAFLLHNVKQPEEGIASGESRTAKPSLPGYSRPRLSSLCLSLYLLLTIRFSFPCSLLTIRYSLLSFAHPPTRGVRSAGGARMHARHPSRHAMTGMQTPHRFAQTGRTRLAFFAHHGRTRRAIDLRKPGKPGLHEASCVPSDGTLAFRRSTWDFWPGPVLAVVRQSLQDRAPTSFDARVIVTRRSGSREPPRRGR
jgi:hypothetical protein